MASLGIDLASLAPLSAQYGPFFFTLLYTLVVPVFSQHLVKRNMSKAGTITAEELAERINSQKIYRTFAISMSTFCLVFSLFWWAYAQLYPPPSSEEAIGNRIEQEISSRIVQGVIRGGNDDDVFMDPQDANYTTYIFPERDRDPMTIRYIVVFKRVPKDDEIVTLYYGSMKAMAALRSAGVKGYMPVTLRFCVNKDAQHLQILRDSRQPALSNNCRSPLHQARSEGVYAQNL